MSTAPTCRSCGMPLSAQAAEGLCPKCLLKIAVGTQDGNPPPANSAKSPPPEPAEVARLFPQLEVLGLLGQGGMGAVYKARQPKLNRLVALKILSRRVENDPAFAERFTREAQTLARLNHPGIVTVYDFGEVNGHCYLLMEFVDGVSLRDLIAGQKMASREALAVVPKICEALQYAHDQGIVHRDIKPENILLDKQGRVKIADFGIAKMLGGGPSDRALTGAKDLIGTPHYMAPEQIEHPRDVDHRADIYSLGVVFYELLTGELPLGKFAPPSKKVEVDVRLDEVVLHALEKEPVRRYQHASEVKSDVESIANTPDPTATIAPPARPGTTAARKSRWPFPLVVLQHGQRMIHWPGVFVSGLFLAGVYGVAWFAWSLALSPFFGMASAGALLGGAMGFVAAMLAFWIYRSWKLPTNRLPALEQSGQMKLDQETTADQPAQSAIPKSRFTRAVEVHFGITFSTPGAIRLANLSAMGFLGFLAFLGFVPLPGTKACFFFSVFFTGFALIAVAHAIELSARRRRNQPGPGRSREVPIGAAPPAPRPDRFWRRFAVTVAVVLLAMILVPVGAVFLAIGLPLFMKARRSQHSEQPVTARQSAITSNSFFGATTACVLLGSGDASGLHGVDLETGRLLHAATGDVPDNEARLRWAAQHGADLMVVNIGGAQWRLAGRNSKFAPVPTGYWDSASTDAVREVLAVAKMDETDGWRAHSFRNDGEMPKTFALQTGAGAVGLMQITNFTQNPAGLALRYKLAMAESPPTLAAAVTLQGSLRPDEWRPVERAARVVGVKLKSKPDKARLCVGVQFTSREAWGVRLNLALLAEDGKALARLEHTEPLGPDIVRTPGHNLDVIRRWDDLRSIWLDLPKQAETATRYTLAVTELTQAPDQAGPSPGFGAVRELLLDSPRERTAQLLDLDTGLRATSTNFGENDRETHTWIRSNRMDVLGVIERGQVAVLCFDMAVVPAASNGWVSLSASEVFTNWTLAHKEPPKVTGISPLTDHTDTWMFRTREGGMGLLQIPGASADTSGIKVRSKMLASLHVNRTLEDLARVVIESFKAGDITGFVQGALLTDSQAETVIGDIDRMLPHVKGPPPFFDQPRENWKRERMEVLHSWLGIMQKGTEDGVVWAALDLVEIHHAQPRALGKGEVLGGMDVVFSDGTQRYQVWVDDCFRVNGDWRTAGELSWKGRLTEADHSGP